jgi:site-specific recombinase XerD
LRVKHYSIRTEQAYVDWIRRYILFHPKRHPSEMGEREIAEFFTHLAAEKLAAASTQNQAFAALLFLYQQVLERKLDFIDNVQRVTTPGQAASRIDAQRSARSPRVPQKRVSPDG